MVVACSQPHPSRTGAVATFGDRARLVVAFADENPPGTDPLVERDISGWLCDLVVLGAVERAAGALPADMVAPNAPIPETPGALVRVEVPEELSVVLFDQVSGTGQVLSAHDVVALAGVAIRSLVAAGVAADAIGDTPGTPDSAGGHDVDPGGLAGGDGPAQR